MGDFQILVSRRARQFDGAEGKVIPSDEEDAYREQVREFKKNCIGPGIRVAIFGSSGCGAFVTAEHASFLVQERMIGFDWTGAQRLLHRAHSIGDQASEWWPWADLAEKKSRGRKRQEENDLERRPHIDRAYDLMTAVLSAVNREHRRVRDKEEAPEERSDAYRTSMELIAEDIARAEDLLDVAAQRRAQLTYTTGMLFGALLLGLICVLIGGVFWATGTDAADGVGLLAGGVGAVLSVLQRMTSGSLRLDVHAGAPMLFRFGALRPMIGAVFGLAIEALFSAGLLPAISIAPEQELAFFGAVGFLAGFNERFAQDMIATTGDRLGAN